MLDVREQRARLVGWAESAKERAATLQAAAQAAAGEVRRLQEDAAELRVLATAAERAARVFDDAARACREAAAATEALAAARPEGITVDEWLERSR